jgi:hypothetical protein
MIMVTRREMLKLCFAAGATSLVADRFGFINNAFAATQPAMDTSSIINPGTSVLNFTGSKWASAYASPRLSVNNRDISSRTGVSSMLRWGPIRNNDETIQIEYKNIPGGNPLSFNGRFGIWIYCKNQPGYAPLGSVNSSINIEMTSDASGNWNSGFGIWFNSNQLREGWNFLKYINNPIGHPEGVGDYCWGMTKDQILTQPVYTIKIYAGGNTNTGATWYLDSLWTDFKNKPQIVLGSDEDSPELQSYCLPVFQNYGWSGYVAAPYRVWTSGSTTVTNWDRNRPVLVAMANAGWETINHTVNHLRMGDLTKASSIKYEILGEDSFLRSLGLSKGLNFYASPQSSSSRLSDSTIISTGLIVAQRHARKSNISITPFGVDNPHHLGSVGLDRKSFNEIKTQIDIIAAYEDTNFMYWHEVTAQGDPGDGSGFADSTIMYKSTWDMTMGHIRNLELNDKVKVKKGFADFLYGANA